MFSIDLHILAGVKRILEEIFSIKNQVLCMRYEIKIRQAIESGNEKIECRNLRK